MSGIRGAMRETLELLVPDRTFMSGGGVSHQASLFQDRTLDLGIRGLKIAKMAGSARYNGGYKY